MVVETLENPSLLGLELGHYRIAEKIGQGGMGEVYRAQDEHLNREVAIKVLPPGTLVDEASRKKFRNEALALSQLNHPNIATIHDFDTQQGVDYLVMEYIPGMSLSEKLGTGPLTIEETTSLGPQLAAGMMAAHEHGIVHRDLKPANLRLTPDGRLKILDFGLAKLVRPFGTDMTTETVVGARAPAGTLPYMAPEQLRAEQVDVRTDIYAAGAVLYEMTTGKWPFRETVSPRLIDAILHQPPAPPSTVNGISTPELDSVILKCLEKDPDKRYQSARDLLQDLPKPKTGWPARRSIASRVGRLAAFAVMVVVFLLAAPSGKLVIERWLGGPPESKRVAVIPFSYKGDNASHQAISDSLAVILTNQLTQIERLRSSIAVIPESEIRSKGVRSAEQARKIFGATFVVTGNALTEGNDLRLLLQLVDTQTLKQLDSRDLRGLATLEPQCLRNLDEMLGTNLRTRDFGVLAAGVSRVPSASASYLEARGNLLHYDMPGRVDTAIRLFEDAVHKDPRYALAYAGLGEAYWRKYVATKDTRWLEPAERSCNQALELDKGLAPVHITCGLIKKGRGNYAQAVEDFQRALLIDDRSYDAHRELANAYANLSQLDLAETTYKNAIQLRPDLWTCYNDLGGFYLSHGRYEDAAVQYQRVIDKAPDSIWGYNNLGASYLYMDRLTEARTIFEKANQIGPDYGVRSNLGTLYFTEGRFAEAAQMYEKALELDNTKYALWGNLASAYYWTPGQQPKARELYRKTAGMAEEVLKVNLKNETVLSRLAVYYAMLNDRARSQADLKRALTLAPTDTDVLYRAALVHEHLRERDQALQWLGKAVEHGYSTAKVQRSPELKNLREDPRYPGLVRSPQGNSKK